MISKIKLICKKSSPTPGSKRHLINTMQASNPWISRRKNQEVVSRTLDRSVQLFLRKIVFKFYPAINRIKKDCHLSLAKLYYPPGHLIGKAPALAQACKVRQEVVSEYLPFPLALTRLWKLAEDYSNSLWQSVANLKKQVQVANFKQVNLHLRKEKYRACCKNLELHRAGQWTKTHSSKKLWQCLADVTLQLVWNWLRWQVQIALQRTRGAKKAIW